MVNVACRPADIGDHSRPAQADVKNLAIFLGIKPAAAHAALTTNPAAALAHAAGRRDKVATKGLPKGSGPKPLDTTLDSELNPKEWPVRNPPRPHTHCVPPACMQALSLSETPPPSLSALAVCSASEMESFR